ncbi:MAG: DUF1254 domain-containing protein [Okeania sp. SIO2D1]|nr:DUF1254 domain-containing protein [Okeania sp. SIO2D1]
MILNRIWRVMVVVAIATSLLLGNIILPTGPVLAQETEDTCENLSDWEEEYAYTLGVQAYIYAFPWTYMPKAYWTRMTDEGGKVNEFYHYEELRDDTFVGGGNQNDTLYSHAVVYLGDEPLILSVPEIDRYYTIQMVDYRGDNFAYVGQRATGPEVGNYAIVGPNWEGELPDDVQKLEGSSSTPWAHLFGRTMVLEEERKNNDLEEVYAIQEQYKLTPLSEWIDSEPPEEEVPELWKPYYEGGLADWKNINHAMADNPPDPADSALLDLFKGIGIGPGLDVELQSESTKHGLECAAVDGLQIIRNAFANGYAQKQVNGWNYPPPEAGRPSQTKDWLLRAMQAESGFIANDPDEAVYLNVSLDGEGNLLTGANRYELRFEKGQQPEVNEFWSITMYDTDTTMVTNPIDRFSVGDRSDFDYGDDGSLTISIQHDPPSECDDDLEEEDEVNGDLCPNWLPAPEGNFYMFMRLYLPKYPGLFQWWVPPALTNLSSPPGDDALSAQAVEDVAQEDFWDTIIQQVEKRYSTK